MWKANSQQLLNILFFEVDYYRYAPSEQMYFNEIKYVLTVPLIS